MSTPDKSIPDTSTHNASAGQAGGRDYRPTVFLPRTDFPMKAGLPVNEPKWLARWAEMDLYGKLRAAGKGREKFTLHDGPPYANGDIHIGHAVNHILKDFVVRAHQMMGYDSNYVPGWDCHGLPIEWAVEQRYRKEGKDKDQVPVLDFLQECRDFAHHWIARQMADLRRVGMEGDWDQPYMTMAPEAEAQIVRELHKFLLDGSLYQGSKPVMWSVVERTALAEAEIEYHERKSPTIWARFPVIEGPDALKGAEIIIWTTTPWTIPGNRAIAYGEHIAYGLYEIKAVGEGSLAKPGTRVLIADSLAEEVRAAAKVTGWDRLANAGPAGLVCAHPLRGQGYEFDVPVVPGHHVTEEAGTGFVHTAPGHGADDFIIGQKFGLETPQTVAEDGSYYDRVPLFAGKRILDDDGKDGDANGAVIKTLIEAGGLLAKGSLRHSYPHSWRSKAPLIFRNTAQWFVSLDKNGLRQTAMDAIAATRWAPARSRARIESMVRDRPDWVLSRQRKWGVPLALFVHKQTGEALRDAEVCARIATAFEEKGIAAWWEADPRRFLGNNYNTDAYEPVNDILDVWFDSASTHAFVLEKRDDLSWPADVYLEGSDQHRGWFQSSLLHGCGTRGRAPFKSVVTHGFVLDQDGQKMSKSKGNTVAPQTIYDQNGAEILRLWTATVDTTSDMRIGPKILKGSVEAYRKLRNTLRFLLGALDGFTEAERLPPEDMPELERLILHRLTELDGLVRQGYRDFEYSDVFNALFTFCTNDLSAFYFDIRKDALYCDLPDSVRRRACRTVLDEIFNCLTAWLAPILVFTMEEVWQSRFPSTEGSVHLRQFPDLPESWRADDLAGKWAKIRKVRRVVTGALELQRKDKAIGSSLEAAPQVYVGDADLAAALRGADLAELAIVSGAALHETVPPDGAYTLPEVPGVGVVFDRADGAKCERCWRVLPDVAANPAALCQRCSEAVARVDAAQKPMETGKGQA